MNRGAFILKTAFHPQITRINADFNPDNPLGRRSGEGRNPAIKNIPRSGQNHDIVPLAWGIFNHLDTGLRRYDTVFSNGLFGFKKVADERQITLKVSRQPKLLAV